MFSHLQQYASEAIQVVPFRHPLPNYFQGLVFGSALFFSGFERLSSACLRRANPELQISQHPQTFSHLQQGRIRGKQDVPFRHPLPITFKGWSSDRPIFLPAAERLQKGDGSRAPCLANEPFSERASG
jgi:hypothetical protein